jgi:hypothetical protein
MSTIFMDESGYTGQDLVNLEQPVFTLATLHCSEDECKELKTRFFKEVKAPELKYKTLMERRQKMILEFMRELSRTPELVKIEIVHKRYILTYLLVDYIIEPAAKKDGFDLYQKGRNIGLTNSFYVGLPALAGEDFFEDLLRRFQEMMRRLDEDSYNSFFAPILNTKYQLPLETFRQAPLDYLLWHIQRGYDSLGYDIVKRIKDDYIWVDMPGHGPLDIGLKSSLSLMNRWSKELSENFTLVYDSCSKMASARYIWDILVDPNLPHATVGYDTSALTFPMKVKKTLLEDSTNWAGLQLVDMLVGAATHWAKWHLYGAKEDDKYGRELELILPSFTPSLLWPSTNVTPEQLGTVDRNAPSNPDYIEKVIALRRLQNLGVQFFSIHNYEKETEPPS